jgi:hypothetical protein
LHFLAIAKEKSERRNFSRDAVGDFLCNLAANHSTGHKRVSREKAKKSIRRAFLSE